MFVDSKFVEHEPSSTEEAPEGNGRLLVTVLERKNELVLIKLPGRTFENGSTVTVKSEQFKRRPRKPCLGDIDDPFQHASMPQLDAKELVIEPEPTPRTPQVGSHCHYDTHSVD